MTLSMYAASVPVFRRALTQLGAVLKKGEAFAAARKIDPAVLTNGRLAPDMFPLTQQVQIASDHAKGATARLAGADVPSWADTEVSFEQLQARIARTLAFIAEFKPAQIEGSEARPITLAMRSGTLNFTGQDYLLGFVLPNLFFHCTAAYLILRHNGVEVGKRDFLGEPLH
jgi:hypothetical protein